LPVCAAVPGRMQPLRALLMRLLPRALKDPLSQVPLLGNLVKGSCAGAALLV
jgi:hypothetical protein